MKGIIDRIEGKYAIVELEDRTTMDIDISLLPKDAKAGDVIYQEKGIYIIDREETIKRKKILNDLMNELFE